MAYSDAYLGEAGEPRDWSQAIGLLLLVLSAVFLAIQITALIAPAKPAYVKRFALSDIPEAPVSRGEMIEIPTDEEGVEETGTAAPIVEEERQETRFEESFGSLERREVAPSPRSASDVADPALPVMNVDFDLARQGAQPGDLEVSKDVVLDGRRLGSLHVSIDQASRLYIAGDDLARMLPGELQAAVGAGGEFRSFEEIRAGGIDIRYDPVRDVLEISTLASEGA